MRSTDKAPMHGALCRYRRTAFTLVALMAFAAAGLASAFFMRETYGRNVTVTRPEEA